MIRGFALVLSGGFLITVGDPAFQRLGSGEFLGVTYPVYLFAGFVALTAFLLTWTTFGRYVYSAGANPVAARLSGVRVDGVRAATYALSGLSAGLAGHHRLESRGDGTGGRRHRARVLGASPPSSSEVRASTAAKGRSGARSSASSSSAMIGNGFNLLNIDPTYQQIIQGAIILLAVAVDAWSRKQRSALTGRPGANRRSLGAPARNNQGAGSG